MEGLGFDYIFGENEIDNLFTDDESSVEETTEDAGTKETEDTGEEENVETSKETTEVDPDDLFGEEEEEKPESVGSGKDKEVKEKEVSPTDDGGGTSPNENFYSSIANAVAVDGGFPNLDEETIKAVTDAESFSKLFDMEVEARLDDAQRRIKKALETGVEPDDIRMYEGAISQLTNITDQQVSDESERGEQLRYRLITQDYLNKGISKEKADKMARRSIDAGTDIEDAKEALQSNREYFQKQYNKLLKEAEEAAEEDRAERKKQAEKLKDSLLKDKSLMGEMDIAGDLRKKAFENISKPIYKDPESGEYLTAIQKYEMEHRADFLKYVGLFYTLTNGFKDFEGFTKGQVKKGIKKGLSELEKTLNGTRRNQDGSLRMVTSVKDDPESVRPGGFKLDI